MFGGVAFPAQGRLVEDEGHKEVEPEDPQKDSIESNHRCIHDSKQFIGLLNKPFSRVRKNMSTHVLPR